MMRGIFLYISIFLFLIVTLLPLWGQSPQFSLHTLNSEKGLSGLFSEHAFQDSKGLIWISSDSGINIYDGNSNVTHQFNPRNSKSIKGSYCYDFFEDNQTNIWFVSDLGINQYQRKTGDFNFFQLTDSKDSIIASDYNAFYLDVNGLLWITTGVFKNGLLHTFNTKTKEKTIVGDIDGIRLKVDFNEKKGVSCIISTFFHEKKGIEILDIDVSKDNFEILKRERFPIDGFNYKAGLIDSNNILWTVFYQGLVAFDLDSKKHKEYLFPKTENIKGAWDAERFRDGQIIVSTDKGLFVFDENKKDFIQKIYTEGNFDNELLENNTKGLYLDNDDNLWVSQWNKGLSFFNLKKNKLFLPKEVRGFEIMDIIEDGEKYVWVSTKGKGVFVYDQNQQLIKSPIITNKGKEKNITFQQLFLSNSNDIWATSGINFFFWNKQLNEFQLKGNVPVGMTFQEIVKFNDNKILGFANSKGLYEIKTKLESFSYEKPMEFDSFDISSIDKYFQDELGNIYLYDVKPNLQIFQTLRGISRRIKTLSLETFLYDFHDTPNDSTILIASSQGIKKLNQYSFEFEPLIQKEGKPPLPNITYYGIIADDDGKLWLTSNDGLYRYDHLTGDYKKFTKAHGLQGMVFKENCHLKASDGKIWVGGMNGLNVIDHSTITDYKPNVRLYFNEFLVNDKRYDLGAHIDDVKEIDLKHHENTITLGFVGMDYSDPESVTARYRIKELNENWTECERGHKITLFDRPYGTYTIEVEATNSEGNKTIEKSRIIRIAPPFWMTWWFWILSLAGIARLIFWYYRKQLKERLAAQQIESLEQLNDFKSTVYTNITHEFKTPLTIIQGNMEHIKGHHAERMAVNRSSQSLLRLINQILDVAKMEAGELKTNYIQADVIRFIKYVVEPMQILADNKDIDLQIELEQTEWELDFDEQKLEHIILNLLSNAIKFTPEDGQVTMHISSMTLEEQPFMRIEVKDSGIGISTEHLQQIFERHFQVKKSKHINKQGTGIGLAFCKELAELMGGRISVESEEGKGSTFVVDLPVHHDAKKADLDPDLTFTPLPTLEADEPHAEKQTELPVVLIIEDNRDVADFIQRVVGKYYQTLIAYDGENGISIARKEFPDLIISDVMMPKKDGFEVCEALKLDEATSHIPIILLTAKDNYAAEIEGLKRGADVYLKKPFRSELLLLHIGKQMELLKGLQERYANLQPDSKPQTETEKVEDKIIRELIEFVEKHIEEVTPTGLEKRMNFSKSTLGRKLKKLTNMRPVQFINHIRLQKGKELLETTNEMIKDIAYQIGFGTADHFSKEFKKVYEMTPSEYRKNWRK